MTFNPIRAGVTAMLISSVISIFMSYPSMATESQLSQSIKPFECVYTTTQTGEQETVTSTCENEPVPTVTKIVIYNSRPIITGSYQANTALMLWVWINGQWYTYGTDMHLTADGDVWVLDLSGLNEPLQVGAYIIMVEVETLDGLLLRNTNAGAFVISESPTNKIIERPSIPGNKNNRQFSLSFPTIVPHTNNGLLAPGQTPILQPSRDGDVHVDKNTGIDVKTLLYVIIVLTAIGGAAYLVMRRLKP